MIWIPESIRSGSSLSAYIKDYLLRSGLTANTINTDCIEDLSQALSAYLESSSDRAGFFVEDGNLLVLASQALRSVGEHRAATRMLILGSGFARPAAWFITANGKGWTVDIARIAQEHHGGLEITFFRCLHAALEALAEAWDQEAGDTVLVLTGTAEAATAILGESVSTPAVQAFVLEVESACRDRLRLLSQQYGWPAPPQIMRSTLRHG